MKKIPLTDKTLALRTDFSDEAAWQSLRAAIQDPARSSDDFVAYVDFVSDPDYAGLTPARLAELISDDSRACAFIIDHIALADEEHPILVVDLLDEPGRTFRVIAADLWMVENNLSTGNMSFDEFANDVDDEQIFRSS